MPANVLEEIIITISIVTVGSYLVQSLRPIFTFWKISTADLRILWRTDGTTQRLVVRKLKVFCQIEWNSNVC